MDRVNNSNSNSKNKKRTRASATSQKLQFSSSSSSSSSNLTSKKPKSKTETTPFDLLLDETEIFNISSLSTAADAISIFDFPWHKDTNKALYYEHTDHGCDLRDVFFSSLVDGCKAAIGVPGDRLSPLPAPILLPDGLWPSDYETDGVDCIWSCVLREPLSLRCVQ